MVDPTRSDNPNTGSWKDDGPRWAVLDPAGEARHSVYSTVYVADELLVDPTLQNSDPAGTIEALARLAGWTVEERGLEDASKDPENREARFVGASRSYRVRLMVAPSERGAPGVAETPDAWQLLRQARADGTSAGISLNHVITTDSLGLDPFKMNPFKMNPFKMNPFKMNAPTVGMDSYATLGFGGRQPVTFVGAKPTIPRSKKRRPVVAIFDTGCGQHPWFGPDVLIAPVLAGGEPIGLSDPATDAELHPSRGRPLEGWLDDAAGHGTFIAGIVRQKCPDAWILPVRVSNGDGVIQENELLGALGRLVDLMQTPEDKGGRMVDVLNLSFSFFHETPGDPTTLSELDRLLETIRGMGCVVVCSAGNDATDRPTSPASLAPLDPRHLSVGALNPSNDSVALFSNIGDWVKIYAPGVSILSTQPIGFNGSMQSGTRDDALGRRRETLDADDFAGGFAVWSGTSFAAPFVAGDVAAGISAGLAPEESVKTVVAECESEDGSRNLGH